MSKLPPTVETYAVAVRELTGSAQLLGKPLRSQFDILENLAQQRPGDVASRVVRDRGCPPVLVAVEDMAPFLPNTSEL